MPEGPEVETIRRTLEDKICGQRVAQVWRSDLALRTQTSSASFRFLVGDRISALSRTGKMLAIETDSARGMFVHFGMSGRLFFPAANSTLEKHTHLRIHFEGSDFELRFIDPRRFGDLKPFHSASEKALALGMIGADVIRFSDEEVSNIAVRIRKSERPIKTILLDQAVLSGVGNIYACEALHLAKISPFRRSSNLSSAEAHRLLRACRDVMNTAVTNKGTTFMSYLDGNGQKGGNQHHLRVFAREKAACPKCETAIMRVTQSGRSTFYCATCQRT